MSSPIWMSIEPRGPETRLMLSLPGERPVLRARLSSSPSHPRALITFLESLSLWHGRPLHAVLDADAEDVRRHPEKWAVLLGYAPELAVRVEWLSVPAVRRARDRFLGQLGEHRSAESLLAFTATGVRR
jgi:hypothetical protein